MSFIEARLPTCIGFGAVMGPQFQTDVVIVNSGNESRNIDWEHARLKCNVGYRNRGQDDTDQLIAFFRSVKGRAHGFRMRDWSDWQVTQDRSVLIPLSISAYQLAKSYVTSGLSEVRPIRKPVPGTVQLFKNGQPIAGTLDTTTGIVTFAPVATVSISGISKAAAGVVTAAAAHGLVNGQAVLLAGIGGMTQLNNVTTTATVLTSTTFSIPVNTTGYGTYTSGGTVRRYFAPADVLAWSGEFDVPVRFDTDVLQIEIVNRQSGADLIYSWNDVPIIEIRA